MLELQHVGVLTQLRAIPECYADCLPYFVDKASVYLRLQAAVFLHSLNSDLTVEQFIALDAIAMNRDMCQRDLAKILLKDRSNVTRIVSILEKNGLIKRDAAIKLNRPVKILKITPKGKKLAEKYNVPLKKYLNDFLADFSSEELEQFQNTLKKIINKISENVNIQI